MLFSGQFRSLKIGIRHLNRCPIRLEQMSKIILIIHKGHHYSWPPYLAGSPHPRWLLLDPRCCCSCLTGCTAGAGRRSTPCRGSYHLWTSLGKVLKSKVQCLRIKNGYVCAACHQINKTYRNTLKTCRRSPWPGRC